MSILVFAWGTPQVRTLLIGGIATEPNFLFGVSRLELPVPLLHQAVLRTPPVVQSVKVEDPLFRINWLAATGTGLLLSALVSGFLRESVADR